MDKTKFPVALFDVIAYASRYGYIPVMKAGIVKLNECPKCANIDMISFFPRGTEPNGKTIFDGCLCGYRSHEL